MAGRKIESDDGPSRHRRVYLTNKAVARHGATPGCSGCVGLGPHTEACRVRLGKASADERADPVETPVEPITEPATESQEPAPAAQQEPASSSSGPAAPMPAQQNEQRVYERSTRMESIRRVLTASRTMKYFVLAILQHNWTNEWCEFLDYVRTIDITHTASPEQ